LIRAAEAFDETLHQLGLDAAELEDERFGRRAALLVASDLL
jgi:cell division protein ZapA (FtsZ GTPase activity inhibitor)